MKLTQEIIDQIQEAMLHTKKDGTVNWKDTDEIVVQLAGTFAADRFIVIKNKTKDPVVSAEPHPNFTFPIAVAVFTVLLAGFGVYKGFFANKGLSDPWDDHDD